MGDTIRLWDAHHKAQGRIQELAQAELLQIMRRIDDQPAAVKRDTMMQVIPALIKKWGGLAGATAAQTYDAVRTAEHAPGNYQASVAEPPPDEQTEASVRYHAGGFWGA